MACFALAFEFWWYKAKRPDPITLSDSREGKSHHKFGGMPSTSTVPTSDILPHGIRCNFTNGFEILSLICELFFVQVSLGKHGTLKSLVLRKKNESRCCKFILWIDYIMHCVCSNWVILTELKYHIDVPINLRVTSYSLKNKIQDINSIIVAELYFSIEFHMSSVNFY